MLLVNSLEEESELSYISIKVNGKKHILSQHSDLKLINLAYRELKRNVDRLIFQYSDKDRKLIKYALAKIVVFKSIKEGNEICLKKSL